MDKKSKTRKIWKAYEHRDGFMCMIQVLENQKSVIAPTHQEWEMTNNERNLIENVIHLINIR